MLGYYAGFWETWTYNWKVSFDGVNKLIYIADGVSRINVVDDLYSAWKEWMVSKENTNTQWSQAFRSVGGDPTSEGQVSPQYFFLMNGWRVVIDGQFVEFAYNLYTEEGVSPFILINGGTVSNRTADIPVSTGVAGATASEVWRYYDRSLTNVIGVSDQINDAVWNSGTRTVDTNNIVSDVWNHIPTNPLAGSVADMLHHTRFIEHSIWIDAESATNGDGSIHSPFNNINDAIDFAESHNTKSLMIVSDIEIERQLKNFTVYGIGTPRVELIGNHSMKGSEFKKVSLSGQYKDLIIVQESVLENGLHLEGFFENCGIAGNLTCNTGKDVLIKDCASLLAGDQNISITMNDNHLSVRSFQGSIELRNSSTINDRSSIELSEGKVQLDSSCSGGEIVVRGAGTLRDYSTGATVIKEIIDPTALLTVKKFLSLS